MIEPFDDAAPTGDQLTEYDRRHIKLYMRLLDAFSDGADWREVVKILFGLIQQRSRNAPNGSTTVISRERAG